MFHLQYGDLSGKAFNPARSGKNQYNLCKKCKSEKVKKKGLTACWIHDYKCPICIDIGYIKHFIALLLFFQFHDMKHYNYCPHVTGPKEKLVPLIILLMLDTMKYYKYKRMWNPKSIIK